MTTSCPRSLGQRWTISQPPASGLLHASTSTESAATSSISTSKGNSGNGRATVVQMGLQHSTALQIGRERAGVWRLTATLVKLRPRSQVYGTHQSVLWSQMFSLWPGTIEPDTTDTPSPERSGCGETQCRPLFTASISASCNSTSCYYIPGDPIDHANANCKCLAATFISGRLPLKRSSCLSVWVVHLICLLNSRVWLST